MTMLKFTYTKIPTLSHNTNLFVLFYYCSCHWCFFVFFS